MDKTLQLQSQIRRNAEEVSSYLGDMRKWEKQIKQKDLKRKQDKGKNNASIRTRGGVGTVLIQNNVANASVNATPLSNPLELTPSSIVDLNSEKGDERNDKQSKIEVAKARGVFKYKDPEEAEREVGNSYFKSGNFPAAVKSYTKCLGLKSGNVIAFSNRAMAYLKLKEFNRAVVDCNNALLIDEGHVKSLSRRAAALNALGKHRAAVRDLVLASQYEPNNKQVRTDLQSSREVLRSSVNRAPMVRLLSAWAEEGAEEGESGMQGPDPAPAGTNLAASSPSPSPPSSSSSTGEVDDLVEVKGAVEAPSSSSKGTKILIEDDDEEEVGDAATITKDSGENIPSPSPSLTAPSLPTPDKLEMASSSNSNSNSSSKGKKERDIRPPSTKSISGSPAITTCYELERQLVNSKGDNKALARVLKGLKMSQARKLLPSLMEPTVLFELMVALGKHYGEVKGQWAKVKGWFELVRGAVRSFSLVCSLLSQEERGVITALIGRVKQEVSTAGGVEKVDCCLLLDTMLVDFS